MDALWLHTACSRDATGRPFFPILSDNPLLRHLDDDAFMWTEVELG